MGKGSFTYVSRLETYAKDPLPTAVSALAADAEDDVLPRGDARPRVLRLLAGAAQHHGVVLGQFGVVERVHHGSAVVRGDVAHVLVDVLVLGGRLRRRDVVLADDGDRPRNRRGGGAERAGGHVGDDADQPGALGEVGGRGVGRRHGAGGDVVGPVRGAGLAAGLPRRGDHPGAVLAAVGVPADGVRV